MSSNIPKLVWAIYIALVIEIIVVAVAIVVKHF